MCIYLYICLYIYIYIYHIDTAIKVYSELRFAKIVNDFKPP